MKRYCCGIERLKQKPSSFPEYQKNLKAGKCVTCGLIPLNKCDPQFGMCSLCRESIILDPILSYDQNEIKKLSI